MTHLELQRLRGRIDEIDGQLIELLSKRFALTRGIGKLKAAMSSPPVDQEREQVQKARYKELALQRELDPTFVQQLFRLVIDEVVKEHVDVANHTRT